jgi:hypothetical protein
MSFGVFDVGREVLPNAVPLVPKVMNPFVEILIDVLFSP